MSIRFMERQKMTREEHPVFKKGVSTLARRWQDWYESWESELNKLAPKAEVLIGLLHSIFKIGPTKGGVLICLEWADGYRSQSDFQDDENGTTLHYWNGATGESRYSWPRYEVARTAFEMLC